MSILEYLFDYLLQLIRAHPFWAIATAVAFVRLWGTVIQTGWTGVLFVFGRARRTLDPGFHFLLPLVHFVRKTPVRSITLDLPKQRVTTADGLVYDVDASVVYRVEDAIPALTHVDNLKKGALVVLALAVQEVVGRHTRQELQERRLLEQAFTVLAQEKLSAWGVKVEQAGFTTSAPTRKTLRVTQLRQLVEERQRVLDEYRRHGLSPESALVLLGSHRQLVGHAQARYRRHHARPGARRAALVQTVPMLLAISATYPRTADYDNVVYEAISETALRGEPLELQIGETVRRRMACRRRIDTIVVQKGAAIAVQPVREDTALVEITGLKEGEAVLLLRNHHAGGETVHVKVTTEAV